MQAFHNIDMTEIIPQNFLTLTVSYNTIDNDEIRAKYPPEIAERLIGTNEELTPIIDENNSHFAIRVNHHYYITKKKDEASAVVRIDNSADKEIKIVKQMQNINLPLRSAVQKSIRNLKKQI